MKVSKNENKFGLLCGLLLILNGVGFSQDIPEPEFVGSVLYIGSGMDELLEQKRSEPRVKGGYYSKAKGMGVIDGTVSKLRLPQGNEFIFIVKAGSNEMNPKSVINIFKLEIDEKRNERFVIVGTAGAFTGSKQSIKYVEFNGEKYKEQSYKIKIPLTLEPGEYAITIEGLREMFNTFRVL